MAMAMVSGNCFAYDGEISVESASDTLEIPLRGEGEMIFVCLTLNNYSDYNTSEYEGGILGAVHYSNIFPFNIYHSTTSCFFAVYNGKADYWAQGVSFTVSGNSIILSNVRQLKTIPGATYHYIVLCKK